MPTSTSQLNLDLSSESISSPTAFGFLAELLPARGLTAEALRDGNAPTTFVPRNGLDRDESEPLFGRMARIRAAARVSEVRMVYHLVADATWPPSELPDQNPVLLRQTRPLPGINPETRP